MNHGNQLIPDDRNDKLLKDGRVFAVQPRKKNLFQMLFKVIEPKNIERITVNLANSKEITLGIWHGRLGHQNITHVRKFFKRNNISFVNEDFNCEACILGKFHRGSYP